ncbi:alpha-L-arabinofuranosidase C-terminal domain-containing protein [Curtobacterium sp. VKM Ac-1376]|uniref:alpha-L-arabinofuranosidase C-terminal domain-containing protein n=1 Tax=Curtobacterium sp. VKM Ac-1376 TaxID=123312 RepID=UPI001889FDDD|nr:alpha-L-arabinofuranosidase C-terminal domain-containing protein [Curtobacterium sp. VKM Ac-1376]MBF4613606.1 alpha-N-arabinofuranosidase [Curtobacterium sp. VKM Ac-1376]
MSATATIRVRHHAAPKPISSEIYGHFLESAFFGNIEGGVFDEGSPLSVDDDTPLRGCRRDVIDAFRDLGLPIVRWPGGNFTSPYHFEDGIGPRDERPRRLELAWGSEETNRFGTPEFLSWCEAVGTTPYLAHSARDVDEAVRWVEYTNYGGDTDFARSRRADGRDEPWDVRVWGVGNEVYGEWQMGHRPVERYVHDASEHLRFMEQVSPGLSFVAVGSERQEWTEAVVRGLGDRIDYVSLHLYAASMQLVDRSTEEWEAVVGQAAYFEHAIGAQSDTIERIRGELGFTRPIAIAIDEWNCRHLEPSSWPEPMPGDDGGIADRGLLPEPSAAEREGDAGSLRVSRYSPRTLADALLYAGVFHAMHRASQRPVPVGMANAVNLVNANGVLAVRPDGVVRTAVFHVWDLYQNHTGRIPLETAVTAPSRSLEMRLGDEHLPSGTFRTMPTTVSLLDVSSTTDADGVLRVAVINRSASDAITTELDLPEGWSTAGATVRTLGVDAEDLFAVNSLSDPDVVTLSDEREAAFGTDSSYTFDAHAITLLLFRA